MFTGGEPFLRKDVVEIAASFYDQGALNLHFSTNGTLVDKTLQEVRAIAEYAQKSQVIIVTSIDGPPEIHDSIRQVAGAHEKAVTTIKELVKMQKDRPNLGIAMNFTLSAYNQDYWQETIDYAREELKVETINIGLTRGETKERNAKDYRLENYRKASRYLLRTSRRAYFSPLLRMLALFKDSVQVENIYQIARQPPPPYYQCLAGRVFNVITETGDVYPCEMLNQKMGNLREVDMDFRRIWKSQEAKDIRVYIRTRQCLCTYECAMTASLAASFITLGRFPGFVLNYLPKTGRRRCLCP
jgi:radical SAM protein with 4Fe4S-binding SPASM domain